MERHGMNRTMMGTLRLYHRAILTIMHPHNVVVTPRDKDATVWVLITRLDTRVVTLLRWDLELSLHRIVCRVEEHSVTTRSDDQLRLVPGIPHGSTVARKLNFFHFR